MPSGGAREGAGRPRVAAAVIKDNKIVERKLRSAAEMGWEVLADSYPDLMRKAIALALGSDGEKPEKPDKQMMKTLVELMVKVVGSEPDQQDTAISQLVRSFIDRLSESDRESGPTVAPDGSRGNEPTNSRDTTGPATNSVIPGMDLSLRIAGID